MRKEDGKRFEIVLKKTAYNFVPEKSAVYAGTQTIHKK
jgi:hypothetical protein